MNPTDSDTSVEQQTDELQRLVELKNLLKQSEETGLNDDPAVEALRERVGLLEAQSDIVEATPKNNLRAHTDLDEDAISSLSDDQAERVLDRYRALEGINSQGAGFGTDLFSSSRQEHLEVVEEVATDSGLSMEDLVPAGTDMEGF